jgi:hypothetical protein
MAYMKMDLMMVIVKQIQHQKEYKMRVGIKMEIDIVNTYGWCEKGWLGIGRAYNMEGDFEGIYFDLFIWRIGIWRA